MPVTDDRLIVALDVPDALAGLALAERLGDAVGFYKIGLGMLTGGGLALARELVLRCPGLRVVLTGAYPLSDPQLARCDCGALGFLPTPVVAAEVASLVDARLPGGGRSSARRLDTATLAR